MDTLSGDEGMWDTFDKVSMGDRDNLSVVCWIVDILIGHSIEW